MTTLSIEAGHENAMLVKEKLGRPSPSLLNNHSSLDLDMGKRINMRATLFDWMFEVSHEFHLTRETLHTALGYVDRYLSKVKNVQKSKLQLVGVTALWIASKYKEVVTLEVRRFVASTDKAYGADDLFLMEIEMLRVLDWNMEPITFVHWVDFYFFKLDQVLRQSPGANSSSCCSNSSSSSTNGTENVAMGGYESLDDDDLSSYPTSQGSPEHSNFMHRDFSPLPGFRSDSPASSGLEAFSRLCCDGERRGGASRGGMAVAPLSHLPMVGGNTGLPVGVPNHFSYLYYQVMNLIDYAVLDDESIGFLPSEVAATALMLVATMQTNPPWRNISVPLVERVTRYTREDLSDCENWLLFGFEAMSVDPNMFAMGPSRDRVPDEVPERLRLVLQTHSKNTLPLFRYYRRERLEAERMMRRMQREEEMSQLRVAQQSHAPQDSPPQAPTNRFSLSINPVPWQGNINPTPNHENALAPRFKRNAKANNAPQDIDLQANETLRPAQGTARRSRHNARRTSRKK